MNASLSSSSSSAQSPNFTSAESARVVSGQRLQYYDDKVKYRAGLRAQNMQKHDMSTPCATARLLRSVFFVCIASWVSRGKQQM